MERASNLRCAAKKTTLSTRTKPLVAEYLRARAPFKYRKIEYNKDGGLVHYGSMRDHLPYVIEDRYGQTYTYHASEAGAKRKVEQLNYEAALAVMTDE